MTYTGEVRPGGASDVRELSQATIRKASVGSMDNNAYLITDHASGRQLLIDAATDAPRLRRLVDEGTGRLDLIVTTHRHHDHVGALADLATGGVPTAAGDADSDALPVPPTRRLVNGDTITLGGTTLDVVELRGHTPGGVALVLTDARTGDVHIFTGDSLFPGGVGNTKNPGQNFDQLIADVEGRLFDAYPDAWIYPGHGNDTTLATERPHLPEWKERGW